MKKLRPALQLSKVRKYHQFSDQVRHQFIGLILLVSEYSKLQVNVFGPLWEECIIRVGCAAALVRGAAFSGGRAVRATMPLYQHAYAERARSLDALVHQHTLPATFERFVERIREPVPSDQPAAQTVTAAGM